jgi:hypothetical protein
MKPITQEMLTLLIQKLQVAMPRPAPQVHLNKGFEAEEEDLVIFAAADVFSLLLFVPFV